MKAPLDSESGSTVARGVEVNRRVLVLHTFEVNVEEDALRLRPDRTLPSDRPAASASARPAT